MLFFPLSAGLLYDKTNNYVISFYFAGGAILVSTLLQLGLSYFKRRSHVREASTYELNDDDRAQHNAGFKDRVTVGNPVPRRLAIEGTDRKSHSNDDAKKRWEPANGNI